jgi:hypothetical protein
MLFSIALGDGECWADGERPVGPEELDELRVVGGVLLLE